MVLGPTRYYWVPPVKRNVHRVLERYDHVTANTYVGHPWPGWMRYSVDFWGPGGRGDAINKELGFEIRHYLMQLPGPPYIRHTIFLHQLWTSFGGASYWSANDHSGELRHLHVTYWKQ
jgi:hypothetical protein